MIEPIAALQEYPHNVGLDGNTVLLRDGDSLLVQVLMDVEDSQQIVAKLHERFDRREAHRHEHRERSRETRVGEMPLRPRSCSEGATFPC